MPYLELPHPAENEDHPNHKIKIMIFTEGTVLGPKNFLGYLNPASYIPIKNCLNLLKSWEEQGAEILYFTSRKKMNEILDIKKLLVEYSFPGEHLYYREKDQKYSDVVKQVVPDVLIEDDCRSIGGKWQMCITYVKSEIKNKINSIVVKEFCGIDDLPQSIPDLLKYK